MAEDCSSPAEPVTVIVAVADRDTRRAWSRTLLEAGYFVRAATRPAEVAKAQSDGTARILVRRENQEDAILTMSAKIPTLTLAATLPASDLPTHLRKALADGER